MDTPIPIHGAEVLDGYCLHKYATIYNAKKYKKKFNNIRYAKRKSRYHRDHGHGVNLFNYTQKRNSKNVSSPLAQYEALQLPIGKSCGDDLDMLVQVDTEPDTESLYEVITEMIMGDVENPTVDGGPAVDGNPPEDGKVLPGEGI